MPTVVAACTDWASKSQRSFLCNVPCQRTEARKCVHNINHIFYQNFMMFLGGYTAFVFYICWGQGCVSMGARVCQKDSIPLFTMCQKVKTCSCMYARKKQ